MANELPAGRYRILSCYDTGLAMDVSGNSTANRARIQVYDENFTDAQIWDVSYRVDGTCRITHAFSGKCMEVYGLNLAQGQAVTTFTDNATDAQQWQLVQAEGTTTYQGTAYQRWFILLDPEGTGSATTWVAELNGEHPSRGTMLDIAAHTDLTSLDRQWIFVPLDLVRDGGVYDIHLLMDPRMIWDVCGLSKADGANLMICGPNGGNNQKFVLQNTSGSYWAATSVFSGKRIQAESVATDANLRQWDDTSTKTEFVLTPHGTKVVDGKVSQVVSFGMRDNPNLVADAAGASTKAGTNIFLHPYNGGSNELWCLKPTVALDANMPVPFNLGMATAVGGAGSVARMVASRLYPTWECSPAWVTTGANHYEWRFRSRTMAPSTSSWQAWDAWSAWDIAHVTVSGQRAWVTEGLPATFEWDDSTATESYTPVVAKAMEWQFEVRSVGADAGGLRNVRSGVASVTVGVYRQPSATLGDEAVFSPDGLVLSATSDYAYGRTDIRVTSITGANGRRLLDEPYLAKGPGFVIPAEALRTWPTEGESLTVSYAEQYDQWQSCPTIRTATATASLNAGSISATPTLSANQDRTITATMAHVGTERLWMAVGDSMAEVPGTVSGSYTTFAVPYPFGTGFTLYTTAESAQGWGVAATPVSATSQLVTRYPPCHAWTWDGGSAVVELRAGSPLTTDHQLSAEHEEMTLSGRRRSAVSFSTVSRGRFTAEGALVPGLTNSTAEAIEAMVGTHCAYRSPSGRVANVAVTDVEVTEAWLSTEVTVEMVEEG